MLKALLYGILERPWCYRLSQVIFAPGAEYLLGQRLRQATQVLPLSGRILDIGCGPSSWLWKLGAKPVGLDICPQYSVAYHKTGEPAMTGSALALPLSDNSFDGVWSIGVLHHLSENAARLAVQEMMRACRPGGYVAVLDAAMPVSPWRRPQAYLVRRLDRGTFMRSQLAFEGLLPDRGRWSISRFTYAVNGLEMVMGVFHKPMQQGPDQKIFLDRIKELAGTMQFTMSAEDVRHDCHRLR